MTPLFALASAVLVGGADFVGGLTSRRAPPVVVAAAAQAFGVVIGVPAAIVYGAEAFGARDAGLSLATGVLVGAGLLCFYAAMAGGLISLVAPVTAVVGAVIPVGVGFARGERPGVMAVVGIPLALAAVTTVALAPGVAATASAELHRALALSLTAGVSFGLFFVVLAEIDESAGIWPVPVQRLASTAILVALAFALHTPLRGGHGITWIALLIAVLEVTATIFLLLALQRGPLAVASVLASLYPVTTVLLAAALLRERLSRVQLAGVLLALVAVVLVAAG